MGSGDWKFASICVMHLYHKNLIKKFNTLSFQLPLILSVIQEQDVGTCALIHCLQIT
jgi:hypothetical protein